MMRFIFFIFLFAAYSVNAFSGSFRHLSVKDGLSSRQVYKICKGADGYMWFFTNQGVDRYDGNEIRHYTLGGESEARDIILSATRMDYDREGTLCIMLKSGKIYSYNKHIDAFDLRLDVAEYLASPIVLNDFLYDRDNTLWLCFYNGIYSFDAEKKHLVAAGLPGYHVNRIIQAPDGSFYAGTNTEVFQLKKTGTSFSSAVQIPLPIQTRIETLYVYRDELFVGTFSDGAFSIHLPNSKVTKLSFIPGVPVRSIVTADEDNILMGTDGSGMYRVSLSGKLLTRYFNDEDDENSLGGNTVSDIFVDERRCIWVSTSTNGISYLDPANPDIEWVKHGQYNQNSLLSSHVNIIFEDSDSDIWYGTNNGVSLYRRETGRWMHFLSDVVITLCEDAQKNIWAGGYGIGAFSINKRTGEVQKMQARKGKSGEGLSTNYIYSIYAEGDDVWLGGIEGELTRYNIRTKSYTYYPLDCVGDIRGGASDKLLIAGCAGLGELDKTSGAVVWRDTFGKSTLHYPVRCLLYTSKGDIWLATDGEGLIRFNPKTNASDVFTMTDGLSSNTINSLVEDNEGRVWFNTEKNLYCLDAAKRKVMSMNEFLHIEWGHFNSNAAIRLRNGNLAFGAGEGALIFSPYFKFDETGPVRLVFTDLKLLYQSVRAGVEGSLLRQAINETSSVKLKYAQNSFSVSFSAINFVYPHRARYEYMLENFNDDWQQRNTIGNIDYMNLSPGKYVFRLRAIDKYTQKVLDERSIEIVIGSPFWASWQALLVYFALFCILFFLFVQFSRHKIAEYNAKEKIRAFIHIAHDIRTPVSLIKAPLSELEAQELPDHSRKLLAMAAKNAEKLFAMVTQLLDLQKSETYSDRLVVSTQDICSYMEEKIADFRMVAIQKGVDLQLDIQPDFPRIWFDKGKMNKIVDNLLSNALKYTEEGFVCVKLTYFGNKWRMEVSDTGIGIPSDAHKLLFKPFYRARNVADLNETGSGIGLLLVRRMVELHHGDITLSSVEHKGSSFVVTFPQKIKSSVVAEEESEMPVSSQEITEQIAPGKNILLLAEDDDDMREYLTSSLSVEYEVVAVADGGKALELAKELNPDIIISDVLMPVLQGDELCRMLKSSIDTSHIPLILLTALSERENVILGLEAGANDYIIKPFDFSVLRVRIRNILQSRQQLRDTVLLSDASLNETDYTSGLDKEFLCRAMEIVNEQLAEPDFSINDFCRELGMSRTSVYNKIKTLTDQSPNDFIRIIRLNKAKELLMTKKFTISEVACMVGFADSKYFSTSFKKQFGTSPSKLV